MQNLIITGKLHLIIFKKTPEEYLHGESCAAPTAEEQRGRAEHRGFVCSPRADPALWSQLGISHVADRDTALVLEQHRADAGRAARQNVARFRLYRRRSLQVNMRFAAFFKIYQII